MRRAGLAAAAAVIGWYFFALWILHPLTDAPVVDSWLYGSAVRRFLRTGEMRFAGFTQAMPIAQVFYGVGWSRAFGGNSVSLEMSVVILAVLCGLMFHALAIRCGASRWQALPGAYSVPLESEYARVSFIWRMFLSANRHPLRRNMR